MDSNPRVSNLRRRALHRAFYIAGSAEELSRRLQMPVPSLHRWLAGKGHIPTPVFLGAVALILDRPDIPLAAVPQPPARPRTERVA